MQEPLEQQTKTWCPETRDFNPPTLTHSSRLRDHSTLSEERSSDAVHSMSRVVPPSACQEEKIK